MAALSEADRVSLWAEWQQENGEACGVTKADLRAAVDAADAWVEASKASYNAALPQPARGALTAAQKARLLTMVVRRRFILGA